MKNILITFSVVFLLKSCGPEPQNNHLTYQNIVILTDLSSRIDNKPQKDIEEIHKIVEYFKDSCVQPGIKIGDKSCIRFSSFSSEVIASIDIAEIKNLGDKQQFVNSTGKFKNNGFNYQIDDFEKKVKSAYKNVRNNGLDLISILNEKIQKEPIAKKDSYLIDGLDTTFVHYDNHIYIFTDGYLEYANKNSNNQFYFGNPEIDNVRHYCSANKVDIKTALEKNRTLCLPPTKNNKNQFINLHVLETHERDKNDKLLQYRHIRGQRDNEILESVWRKWATESGFKNFFWEKY